MDEFWRIPALGVSLPTGISVVRRRTVIMTQLAKLVKADDSCCWRWSRTSFLTRNVFCRVQARLINGKGLCFDVFELPSIPTSPSSLRDSPCVCKPIWNGNRPSRCLQCAQDKELNSTFTSDAIYHGLLLQPDAYSYFPNKRCSSVELCCYFQSNVTMQMQKGIYTLYKNIQYMRKHKNRGICQYNQS